MNAPTMSEVDRREFLRGAAAGGFGFGSLLGLGYDLRAAQEKGRRFPLTETREVPSICPYCAVGCSLLVSVHQGKIVNIEGNPDSPVNAGTLCPKGAATFQLAVNPNRITRVWYRAPGATEWDKSKTLDWAMDRIAQRVQESRNRSFEEIWETEDDKGQPVQRRVNHTRAIASLGGATMDNEWNYVHAKVMRALGVVCIENQARI